MTSKIMINTNLYLASGYKYTHYIVMFKIDFQTAGILYRFKVYTRISYQKAETLVLAVESLFRMTILPYKLEL